MAALDVANLTAILKQQYTPEVVKKLAYLKNPLFAKMKKKTDFVGSNHVVAVKNAYGQGRAFVFATAQANIGPDIYNKFTVTRTKDYALFSITGEAIDAAGTDGGALLNSLKDSIDGSMMNATRSLAIQMYRNSGGARGRISTGSTVSSATITLATIQDITNFEVGMVLNTASTDGTSGAIRVGTVTVQGVDRDLGTITATGAWNSGISAVAVSDYIFQNGDFASTKSAMAGLLAWLPLTAPTSGDSFFGLDRSQDATRLAGVRYTAGAGGPIEESLVGAAARLAREGSIPDACFMNPDDFANFLKAVGSKSEYERTTSKSEDASVSFKGLTMIGPSGAIDVTPDLNCPKGYAFMLQMDTWTFKTLKGAPRILEQDGLQIMRSATADAYEGRVGYYGNTECCAPGWNAVITL